MRYKDIIQLNVLLKQNIGISGASHQVANLTLRNLYVEGTIDGKEYSMLEGSLEERKLHSFMKEYTPHLLPPNAKQSFLKSQSEGGYSLDGQLQVGTFMHETGIFSVRPLDGSELTGLLLTIAAGIDKERKEKN